MTPELATPITQSRERRKMSRLSNRTVIVTSAAQGIEAVYAKSLAAEGASVSVYDLQSPDTTVSSIKEAGDEALNDIYDISDSQDRTVRCRHFEQFGTVDGWRCADIRDVLNLRGVGLDNSCSHDVRLTIAAGEIAGGAGVQAVGGVLADRYGLSAALWFCSGPGVLALLVAFTVKEKNDASATGRQLPNRSWG